MRWEAGSAYVSRVYVWRFCHSKEEAENARQAVFTDHGTRTTASDIVKFAA